MKLYLAGPMTGIPKFNFQLFRSTTVELREAGFEVCSPHEEDSATIQQLAWSSPNGDPSILPNGFMLDAAVRNVADIWCCDGLALLAGWMKSTGARHEVATAERFHMPVAPVNLWMRGGVDD